MPLNRLIAYLDLNKTGFEAGLSAAGKQAGRFGDNLKQQLAGAFTTAAIVSFARNTIEAVSKIADLSKQLGVSAEALQEMDYWAKQNGGSIDAIARSFTALAKARAEAIGDPGSKSGQAFSALGISGESLKSDSLEQTFRKIASAIKSTDFGASELAIVAELLGRSGSELIPLFRAGLEEASKAARDLGLIINEGVVNQIDEVGDSIDRLTTQLRGPMASAIGFVADRFGEIRDLLDMTIGGIGVFIGGIINSQGNPLEKWKAASQMVADHMQEILDRRIAEEAAAVAAVNDPAVRVKKAFEFAGKETNDKVIKAAKTDIQSDQFGRIGAFTGAAAGASQISVLGQQLSEIKLLRQDLINRGILIKGTD